MKLTFLKTFEKAVVTNAPAILTGIGVVGTVATAYLTARATFKAAKEIDAVERMAETIQGVESLSTKEKAELVWQLYILPVGVGVGTCAAIIMANHINAKRAAALVAGYAMLENRHERYIEKVKEMFGEEKKVQIDEQVAKGIPKSQIVIIEGDNYLMHEAWTGRLFHGNVSKVKQTEVDINRMLQKGEIVTLNDVYSRLGLDKTSDSDSFGWIGGDVEDATKQITITIVPIEINGKPAMSFDYDPFPEYDFWRKKDR